MSGKAVFEETKRNNGDKDSGICDARNVKATQVRTSLTNFRNLDQNCWNVILDYLNVEDQLRLVSSDVLDGGIFKSYASHRYKNIDDELTSRTSDKDLKQLLQIVGENVEHLEMTFESTKAGWDYLNSLKKLKSLHANMNFEEEDGDMFCTGFIENLKKFTCLRKLKLDGFEFSVKGLHVLDQLESLDVRLSHRFDAKNLADCCQTMRQLRHLRFGAIENIGKNHFEILVTNCKQLERLSFGLRFDDSTVPYELVCRLPRLQHLEVWHSGSIHDSFIEGLMNKQGSPLESLILERCALSADQIKNLCSISTLKELSISCAHLPLEDLRKLKSLLFFRIYMPSITNDQILDLLKGLPRLKVLNLLNCRCINNTFLQLLVRQHSSWRKR
ncbi:GL26298 [Drosophila persimilis]|uniref:GL26298 n=1 Tax=Drosophila persimilis TaxID=7234 RepID=B4GSA7_DROPE|nr:GL26298 [Drosophila persimilis]